MICTLTYSFVDIGASHDVGDFLPEAAAVLHLCKLSIGICAVRVNSEFTNPVFFSPVSLPYLLCKKEKKRLRLPETGCLRIHFLDIPQSLYTKAWMLACSFSTTDLL